MLARLTYSSNTLTLKLTDTVTTKTFTTSWVVNIPTVIGSSTAWVGFTAGTGGLTATQDIVNWKFGL